MPLGSSLRGNSSTHSNSVMTPNDIMNVASGAPTPWNPDDNKEIRTEKVVTAHKNFDQKDADELTIKAATRKRQAKTNRQAYKALRSIESADVSDQTTFRSYQSTVARGEAARKRADVGKAKTLLGLTPQYAQMGYSLGAAHHDAGVKVQEYQALYSEVDRRWK